MKNYLRLGWMAISLILFVGTIAITNEVKAQGGIKIAGLYQLMENNRITMTSLKASLVMTKYNSQIEENDSSSGTLLYLPTAKTENTLIRIDWVKPKKEILIMNKGQYLAAREELRIVYRGEVDRKNANVKTNGAMDFLGMSKDQLKNTYDPKFISDDEIIDGTNVFHLKLTPKSKKDYQYAEVWIDGKGVPIQGRIVEKNNDSTTIIIGSNYQRNFVVNQTVLSQFSPNFKGYKEIWQ